MLAPKGRSIVDDASHRATEGRPEWHPGGEGSRAGECRRQPLGGEMSGSERVKMAERERASQRTQRAQRMSCLHFHELPIFCVTSNIPKILYLLKILSSCQKIQTNPPPPFFPSLTPSPCTPYTPWSDRSSFHSSSPSPHMARSLISWARASIAILRSKGSRSRSKFSPTARNRSRSLAGVCTSSQKTSAFSAPAPCRSLSSKI